MFFLKKLLAAIPFGNALSGAAIKIVLVGSLLVGGYSGWRVWLSKHDEAIREATLNEFNTLQVIEDQRARDVFQHKLDTELARQDDYINTLLSEIEAFDMGMNELLGQIRNGDFSDEISVGSDNPTTASSSRVLRETIRALQNRADTN